MADVRALLQREREARRIQHPHLSYSKSGALTCTICNLNVKSEALWEGHLRSANHRRNLQEAATSKSGPGNGKKRKIEEVTEQENPRKRKTSDEELEGDGRKKRQVSFQIKDSEDDSVEAGKEPEELPGFVKPSATAPQPSSSPPLTTPSAPAQETPTVDEDEWAAFEAEVAPLTRPIPQDYSNAVISAAPVSATELAVQEAASSRRSTREIEAEDEKQEEEQRLAEEFDVMEEMEQRVRRLKEKREALRMARPNVIATPAQEDVLAELSKPLSEPVEADSDDESNVDDWFS